jgi:4-amino-4-deoxy-L-arabinose transferase-like glycosyltransferase
VIDLGRFVTIDEIYHWMGRSERFLDALKAGDFAATAVVPHPGVTTMWLGGAGIFLQQQLLRLGLLSDTSFSMHLALMQLPLALTHALGVVLGFALLRRIFPATLALLAALLWATDPFLIGYSRVLHVDALAATFGALSLLAACLYWHHSPRWRFLALSAGCAALAMLSKLPAVTVLPIVLAIAATAPRSPRQSRLRSIGVWAGIFALVVVIVWPAVWAAPLQTIRLITSGVNDEAGQVNSSDTIFLGQVDTTPGPSFYPIALVLRATPWSLLGLLLLPLAPRRLPKMNRHDMAALIAFALLFLMAMSVFPKKGNRYLVPIFPMVDILAAIGLASLVIRSEATTAQRAVATVWQRTAGTRLAAIALCVGIALAGMLNASYWHPFDVAAFNQALGGASAGAYAFQIGWGEGLEQAAQWINQQPDRGEVVVVSTHNTMLTPYLSDDVQVEEPQRVFSDRSGYVVVYVRSVQDGLPRPPFDSLFGKVQPAHLVDIHGVPYVWIYRISPPAARPRPAMFGDDLSLVAYTWERTADERVLSLRIYWQTKRRPTKDYALFAHIVGSDGQRYAQADPVYPTSTRPENALNLAHLPLALPASLPPGSFAVIIGLYDPATGQRLPLTTSYRADRALDGDDAMVLAEFQSACDSTVSVSCLSEVGHTPASDDRK